MQQQTDALVVITIESIGGYIIHGIPLEKDGDTLVDKIQEELATTPTPGGTAGD